MKRELFYTLEGLYSVLKNKFWISNPTDIKLAENKILQLLIATEIGFKLPKSLISSVKYQQIEFAKNKNCIIKPIKTGLVDRNEEMKLIYTNKISECQILENDSLFPSYLQEEINKICDVRVTVVIDKIFAAKITPSNKSEIDWRKNGGENLIYEPIELPSEIASMCIKLLN